MRSWQAADVERNFDGLVDAAQSEPQLLVRQTRHLGIVMSVEHYERLKAQADGEFARFLISSPLSETDVQDVGMKLGGG